MLFLYYLLHLDGNGQAPGLAGFYRVLAQQREGPPPTIDDYRKAIVEYRTAGARRDQLSRERTVALTAYEEAVRNHVKPLPARPPELPPEPRIPEILKKIPDQQAFEALVRERRKEADKALLRGRTFAEVALDFKAKMAPLLGE